MFASEGDIFKCTPTAAKEVTFPADSNETYYESKGEYNAYLTEMGEYVAYTDSVGNRQKREATEEDREQLGWYDNHDRPKPGQPEEVLPATVSRMQVVILDKVIDTTKESTDYYHEIATNSNMNQTVNGDMSVKDLNESILRDLQLQEQVKGTNSVHIWSWKVPVDASGHYIYPSGDKPCSYDFTKYGDQIAEYNKYAIAKKENEMKTELKGKNYTAKSHVDWEKIDTAETELETYVAENSESAMTESRSGRTKYLILAVGVAVAAVYFLF